MGNMTRWREEEVNKKENSKISRFCNKCVSVVAFDSEETVHLRKIRIFLISVK